MSALASSRYALLLDLAGEPSSEKRRELLIQLTDVFITAPAQRSEREAGLFDDIYAVVAADLETNVRAQLANKIAASDAPLRRTARSMALDDIEVAQPVVQHSRALLDDDLLEIVQTKSGNHQNAVARREHLTARVSAALVDTGSDRVLSSLLENRTATISRSTFEKVAERAAANPKLHAPFVKNINVPLDLLNAIYLKVADSLRRQILQRFQGVSVEELNAALEVSRDHVAAAYGALPADFVEASEYVANLTRRGELKPSVLADLLRNGQRTVFLIVFARLVDADIGLVQRLVESRDIDGLALLCRSASFPRGLFVTLCLMVGDDRHGMAQATAYGELYEQATVASAQRAVRFWRMRSKETMRSAMV